MDQAAMEQVQWVDGVIGVLLEEQPTADSLAGSSTSFTAAVPDPEPAATVPTAATGVTDLPEEDDASGESSTVSGLKLEASNGSQEAPSASASVPPCRRGSLHVHHGDAKETLGSATEC